jgi:hypothetical protein
MRRLFLCAKRKDTAAGKMRYQAVFALAVENYSRSGLGAAYCA